MSGSMWDMPPEADSEFFQVRCEKAYDYAEILIGEYCVPVREVLEISMLVAFQGNLPDSEVEFTYELGSGENGSLQIESERELSSELVEQCEGAVGWVVELYAESDGIELVESLTEFFCEGVSGELDDVDSESVVALLLLLVNARSALIV